jgi:outer membrane protein OmpA-like peptidoglycan-associated protein
MSFNLLDVAKGYFNNEVVSKASSFLGESEGGISKALGGILPTVLTGLADKAGTSHGATEVANMAGEAHSSGILGSIGDFFGGGSLLSKGGDLVKGLFGSKLGGIVDVVSKVAGLKSGSTSSLMGMALPVILGALGKHSSENNLGASGISSLLSGGKSLWSSLLPAGLGNILGGVTNASHNVESNVKNVASHVKSTTTNYAEEVAETTGGGMKWLLPLLLLGALGFLAWYLMGKGCNKTAAVDAPIGDTSKPAAIDTSKTTTVAIPAPTTGAVESTKVKIAGGAELNANKGGIEEKLVAFLNDANAKVDTANKGANWYDFDNLNFDLGKSTITAASMVQVNNLIAILKAYPTLKVKIGGYTDKKGDDKANLTLSQSRADAVLAALKAGGANAAQITKAEGYGETMATVAETASDEARRADRRTSVKVVSK